jgi:hypothetical protein
VPHCRRHRAALLGPRPPAGRLPHPCCSARCPLHARQLQPPAPWQPRVAQRAPRPSAGRSPHRRCWRLPRLRCCRRSRCHWGPRSCRRCRWPCCCRCPPRLHLPCKAQWPVLQGPALSSPPCRHQSCCHCHCCCCWRGHQGSRCRRSHCHRRDGQTPLPARSPRSWRPRWLQATALQQARSPPRDGLQVVCRMGPRARWLRPLGLGCRSWPCSRQGRTPQPRRRPRSRDRSPIPTAATARARGPRRRRCRGRRRGRRGLRRCHAAQGSCPSRSPPPRRPVSSSPPPPPLG